MKTDELKQAMADTDELLESAKKWEATNIGGYVDDKPYTIAEFRRLFEEHQDKDHWKNPWKAVIEASRFNEYNAAVEFYHGEGLEVHEESVNADGVKMLLVGNSGYACW